MENPQSVCFVGKIEQINNIEGADKIVQAVISGWECVIQKDKYKAGDLVVIATTDAVIPLKLAEDLAVTNYLKNRKKTGQLTVKTTKLRGVYSTAMIVSGNVSLPEGTDTMKDFGIIKYEEPAVILNIPGGKKIRYHTNPNFHVYHKFPNARNAPNIFTPEDEVIITRKLHGCNARYGIVKKSKLSIIDRIKKFFGNKWIEYDYIYGSHEVEKGSSSQGFYSTDVWREVGDRYKIKEKLWSYLDTFGPVGEGIILYGEIYGPGIQKYYDYSEKELKFQLFDIKLNGEYVSTELFNLTSAILDLPKVEVYYKGKYSEDEIKKYQIDRYISNTKIPEEGVVVKSITGDRSKIAKYINPAYLEFQSKKEDSTDFH